MKIREQIRRMIRDAIEEFDFSDMISEALENVNVPYLIEKKIKRDLDLTEIIEEIVEDIIDEELGFIDADTILKD